LRGTPGQTGRQGKLLATTDRSQTHHAEADQRHGGGFGNGDGGILGVNVTCLHADVYIVGEGRVGVTIRREAVGCGGQRVNGQGVVAQPAGAQRILIVAEREGVVKSKARRVAEEAASGF